MINEEPHQGLKPNCKPGETRDLRKDYWAGDAWPSSVRGLNCSLKWANERNPRCLLQVSGKTAPTFEHNLLYRLRIKVGEEGEDDARSACPFDTLGYTHNTMAATTGCDDVSLS